MSISIDEQMNISVSLTGKSRTNLALHHLFAACRFVSRIGEVERENDSKAFGAFWEEILHNALGVAMLSVACLECFANELYLEESRFAPNLNPLAASALTELIDNRSILEKFSVALAFRVGKKLDLGAQPAQNADALIKLRNAVMHFRPEWIEEQDRHEKLSKILQYRFKTSQFFPNEPIFPRAWASYDFSAWALRTAVAFLDHFYSEAGLQSPIEAFRKHLSELSSNAL